MPISTSFKKVPYKIVGDSFISSAKDLTTQYNKNMFAVPSQNSLSEGALLSVPGLKLWSTGVSNEPDRGIHKRLFLNKGWKVSGQKLYSFDSLGVQTEVGAIPGSDIVSISDNGVVLVIVASGVMYSCDGTTVSTVTLSFTPIHIDYINDQFLVLDNANFVWVSNVGTTTFQSSNTYEAASVPDDLIGIKVFNQIIFNAGARSIEPWENTGVGNPPVERMNGAILEDVGVANRFSMCATSKALYLLGSDKIPYRIVSFQAQKLTDQNFGINELFGSYNTSSAYVECWKMKGQDIIGYFFPVNKKVWCYAELTGIWFELDHDVDAKLYKGKTSSYLFNKVLWGDRENGNIYEMDDDTYQNNSTSIARERVFRPFSGENVASIREYLQFKMIQFSVETGVGVDANMMVSYSIDGGRTYSNEVWISLGEDGDYREEVEDHKNFRFKDLTVKIRYVGNTRFSLYDSAIYIRGAGKS